MRNLYKFGWFLTLLVMILGCTSTPTTSPAPPTLVREPAYPIRTPGFDLLSESYPGPYPTPILPTATYTPTPSATPFTSVSSLETLDFYPLRLGNFWTYSAVYYGYQIEGEGAGRSAVPITSTFVITDKVIKTEINEPYYIAQIERSSTLIDGPTPNKFPFELGKVANPASENFLFGSADWGIMNPTPRIYWYVIGGSKTHYQDKLDIKSLPSSPLYYYFPLSEHICWFPNGDETICKEHLASIGGWTGFYFVASGPITQQSPIGNFVNCFDIQPFSRGGGVIKHFCSDVGLVGLEWEYGGQRPELYSPIGFKIELIDYFGAEK